MSSVGAQSLSRTTRPPGGGPTPNSQQTPRSLLAGATVDPAGWLTESIPRDPTAAPRSRRAREKYRRAHGRTAPTIFSRAPRETGTRPPCPCGGLDARSCAARRSGLVSRRLARIAPVRPVTPEVATASSGACTVRRPSGRQEPSMSTARAPRRAHRDRADRRLEPDRRLCAQGQRSCRSG